MCKNTAGKDVAKPQFERLGYAQSRSGDQPEQHHIELLAQGIGLLRSELTGSVEDADQLIPGVDIGNRPRYSFSKEINRHLMRLHSRPAKNAQIVATSPRRRCRAPRVGAIVAHSNAVAALT